MFTVHSFAAINRKRKSTPTAGPVKRTRLAVTIEQTIPEEYMLGRKNKRLIELIELITKRDNINNALWEENKELRKSLTEREQKNNELGLVITHLEDKLESQLDAGLEEALNQGVKETRDEEQKQLTNRYKQTAEEEVRKSCTLKRKGGK